MRHPFLLIACLLLTTVLPASAQLFSGIAECDALYGPPVEPTAQTSDVRFYKKDDLKLKILFTEARAHVVTFSAPEAKKIEAPRQLELLALSAANARWEPVEGAGPTTWQRSDGLAYAFYESASGELTVMTAEYLEKSASDTATVSQ